MNPCRLSICHLEGTPHVWRQGKTAIRACSESGAGRCSATHRRIGVGALVAREEAEAARERDAERTRLNLLEGGLRNLPRLDESLSGIRRWKTPTSR